MRYFEIAGGIRLQLSQEEQNVLSTVEKSHRLPSEDMDERQEEIARQMVRRGLLNRVKVKDKEHYIANNDPPLTRF
jgi:hypothetical protein